MISIHAAREGGDSAAFGSNTKATQISIHAAREGGDGHETKVKCENGISIHAAREGGDAEKTVLQ